MGESTAKETNADMPPVAWFVHWYMEDGKAPFAGQHGGPCYTPEEAEQKAAEMRERGVKAGRGIHVEIVKALKTWSEELQCYHWGSETATRSD